MKKSLALLAAILLAACGDTIENQMGMEVVTSVGDLPKCTSSNEGEQAYVKGEPSPRICVDGEWFATKSTEGSDFACKTEELKDKSGLKIVCNGDSIGVVLNGSDGKDGKAGKDGEDGQAGTGCAMKEKTDSTITVVCGDSTMVIELGSGSETPELDSERVAVSLDSLAGYSQKGPFLKGSTVYLYELSDGRTLKQTNGNFTSNITRDDGRYKFTARDLASQYAMIVVEGNYRNEVTGVSSNAPIRLKALTDMRKKSDANINLLTTLEFDRVYHLVTREGMTVKKAKKQAQAEIMKQFHIDTTGFSGSAEDLNVFGESDADAALLAISVLLQGDGNETDLSVLLTEISNDMESDGVWDDSTTRARIADWALEADTARISRLDTFRVNVKSWGLSDTVPGFEKFLRGFVAKENNFGVCGSSGVPIGTVKHVSNSKSAYYAKKYDSIGKDDSKIRFICKDKNGARWVPAADIEKDTVGFGHNDIEGAIRRGIIDTNLTYVYENGNWRHGTDLDSRIGIGCIEDWKDSVLKVADTYYKCKGDSSLVRDGLEWTTAWRIADYIEKDTLGWGGSFNNGEVRNGSVTGKFTYVFENGAWRYGTELDSTLEIACIMSRKDTVVNISETYYKCKGDTTLNIDGPVQASAWRPASNLEKDTVGWGRSYDEGAVRNGSVNRTFTYVFENGYWRHGTESDSTLGIACIMSRKDTVVKISNNYYRCKGDTTMVSDGTVWTTAWRPATSIEKATYQVASECREGGLYGDGSIYSSNYVCDNGEFRAVTSEERNLGRGCVSYILGESYPLGKMEYHYTCLAGGWDLDKVNSFKDPRDNQVYKTITVDDMVVMAEDLNFNPTKYKGAYIWSVAMDSVGEFSTTSKGCGNGMKCSVVSSVRGICPEGWHLPDTTEWDLLYHKMGSFVYAIQAKDVEIWPNATDEFGFSARPTGTYISYESTPVSSRAAAAYWTTRQGRYTNVNSSALAMMIYEDEVIFGQQFKSTALHVRCFKN